MAKTAILKVDIISDFNDRGVKKTETGMQKLGRASKVAAGALAGITGASLVAVKAGEGLATAQAQVSQVLSSMGYDENAQDAIDYAHAMEKVWAVDEKTILAAQTKLATFDDVAASADLMARATENAANLSAAGFGDMSTVANGLGKALQDPIKGMSLLTKQGSLTKAEQEKIGAEFKRTGDKAAAQDAILRALEKQTGGLAETSADGTEKMRLGFQGVVEAIGVALLPVVEKLVPWVEKLTDWMIENKGAAIALAGTVASLAAGILVANTAVKVYTATQKLVQAATAAWTLAQKALNVALRLNPIGLVITAIAALVAGIVWAYKNSDTFRAIVDKLWQVLKYAFASAVKVASSAIQTLVGWLRQAWSWVTNLLAKVRDLLSKLNPLNAIGGILGKLTGRSAQLAITEPRAAARATRAAAPTATRTRTAVTISGFGDPQRQAQEIGRILSGARIRTGYTGVPA